MCILRQWKVIFHAFLNLFSKEKSRQIIKRWVDPKELDKLPKTNNYLNFFRFYSDRGYISNLKSSSTIMIIKKILIKRLKYTT